MKRSLVFELLSVAAIVWIGIAVLFGDVLFNGKVLVPADLLAYDPLFQEALPDPSEVNNYLLSDHLHQFYVWHSLAARTMQTESHIPLWNPYFLGGQPLVANAQPALFYPPNLLLFRFDAATVANIRILFNILVAAIFTFLFCRSLQISYSGSLLSAIAFAFSGPMMVGPGHAYANCLVWLPFIMWSGGRLLRSPNPYVWGFINSLGIGLSMVGGHPESSFHNMLIFSAYFSARLLSSHRSSRESVRYSLPFVVAVGVGLLIGAIQLLPFGVHLSQSAFPSRSQSWTIATPFHVKEWLPNLSTLVTLLYPNFFGNPVGNSYTWPFANNKNYLEQAMYFGIIPAALAVGAVVTSKRKQNRGIILILAVIALLALCIALRLPGFEALNYLPIMKRVNNTRLKWYFSFLGAILAGFGLDAVTQFLRYRDRSYRNALFGAATIFGMAWLVLGAISVAKYGLASSATIASDKFASTLLFSIFSFSQPKTAVSIFVIIVTPLLCAVLFLRLPSQHLLKATLLSLTLLELLVQAYGYNTTVSRDILFPEIPVIQELQQDPNIFRVMGSPPILWPNYGAIYGLFQVGGYDLPVFKLTSDLYLGQGGKGYRQIWQPDWPLVDWMNVKYVFSQQPLSAEKFELVVDRPTFKLYRNTAVLPRAYMVYHVHVIPDEDAQVTTLTSGQFDFSHTAVLATNPLPKSNEPNEASGAAKSSVDVLRYTNDRIDLRVTTQSTGLLVTSEVYTPDWKVQVDGQYRELLRANHAYRAVVVPAGDHTVTFAYQPWAFALGRALTLLGLVVAFVGTLLSSRSNSHFSFRKCVRDESADEFWAGRAWRGVC